MSGALFDSALPNAIVLVRQTVAWDDNVNVLYKI